MSINVLEPKIFNRIAAGEVVERPASIVKELIENSIDAHASEITIEIENGGIKKIAITDNGCGIDKEDLTKAFLPHATSKIKNIEDLDAIATLGFRGEALSSIASVCHVTLSTKTENSDVGYMINVSLGDFSPVTEIARNKGTTIVASDLFYNIPARAKFLKKPKFEESEITHLVEKFMLAHSEIAFKYYVDGNLIYNTTSCELSEIIYTIYGKDVYQNIIKVDYESNGIKVEGYVSSFKISKPNRTSQVLFVNNRYVENYFVSACVQTVYEPFLMKGKFPLYVLNLVIPYEDVDVNVHPNKKEVKFEDQRKMFAIIKSAVENALLSVEKIAVYNVDDNEKHIDQSLDKIEEKITKLTPLKSDEGISFKDRKKIEVDENTLQEQGVNNKITQKKIDEIIIPDFSEIKSNQLNSNTDEFFVFDQDRTQKATQIIMNTNIEREKKEEKFLSASVKDDMKIIGVIFNTYIVVEYQECIYLIDQHAAHERLLYDKLKNQIDNYNITKQDLLVPYHFKVESNEIEIFEENMSNLISLGFEINSTKTGEYDIVSVPAILININLANFIEFILKDSVNWDIKASDIIKERLCQNACKHAIKGGDKLSEESCAYLIDNMRKGVMQCPHGRPSIIEVNKKEIEKLFKRIV